MENSRVGPALATSVSDDATVLKNEWFTLVVPPASFNGSSGGEISLKKIDSTEDAIEREHCYICDEKLRTGWKSSKHIDGRHLILTIWTRWTSYYFFLVFLNVIYFNVFVILTWETFVVWSWLFIQWKLQGVPKKNVI